MRLIDADAVMADIEETIENSGCVYHEKEIIECVQYAPTIEASPVKRGKWKLYGNDDDCGMSYWCSVCNFHLDEDLFYHGYENGKWIENGVFKHCPHCGAKMEGQ